MHILYLARARLEVGTGPEKDLYHNRHEVQQRRKSPGAHRGHD